MAEYARGIDVSRWQGAIDWDDRALGPIEFAIVKLSDGVTEAARAQQHLLGVRGTTILPGVYHLWQAGLDGAEQARAMLAALPEWYGRGCLPPALDAETSQIDGAPLPADDVASMLAWAEVVRAELGVVRPLLYVSSRGIWHLERALPGCTIPLAQTYDIWVCDYDRIQDDVPAPGERPDVPAPWSTWRLWQYTSSLAGRRYGAHSSRLDGDLYHGSERELARWAQEAWGA